MFTEWLMMKVVEHPITRFHLIKPNSDESETIPYKEGERERQGECQPFENCNCRFNRDILQCEFLSVSAAI